MMDNSPYYYNVHKFECFEEMRLVFGIEAVKTFCRLNVWKYRYRNGNKPNTDDAKKADDYIAYLKFLDEKRC